ncbi:MAG: alpha/beta hydrolase [archaeon]
MQKKITFHNSKGDKLVGILSNPTEDKEKIVLICHGLASNKDRPIYVKMEEALNKNNIATFRFDFFGQGKSEGKFEEITMTELVDDILQAVLFLKIKGYSEFGIFGSSMGGTAAIIAATRIEELYVLAIRCSSIDYHSKLLKKKTKEYLEDWKEKGFVLKRGFDGRMERLNYTMVEDVVKYDGFEACKEIGVPTILVHGEKDESSPVEQVKKAAKLIKNCKLEILKGVGHHFTEAGAFEKGLELLSDFIISHS